jgi:diguanylate cyclase (GGDEF)-like protein
MISEADPQQVRVLIVDDDPSTVQQLTGYLTEAGYAVLTAENGAEGLRILATEGAPVVITEWKMPQLTGLQLCRAIREHEGIPFAYVMMVTVRSDEEALTEAFEAGVDDFLTKPVSRREVLARMRAGERVLRLHQDVERKRLEAHLANAQQELIQRELEELNKTLNRMAITDELTGLLNRREAMARLEEYWGAAQRHGHPMACIALDIDHFKSFNDGHGHAVGDLVLKQVAGILRDSARRDEKVCRVGGEEFLILCPHATEAQAAKGAERIRQAIESHVVASGDLELRVTTSSGVAQRTPETKTPDDLLRAADDALYAAKEAGRNRVCLASVHPEWTPPGKAVDTEEQVPPETIAGHCPQ